jgi:SpoVK/Ycf46/Vps4 family AAA+-type ATPase
VQRAALEGDDDPSRRRAFEAAIASFAEQAEGALLLVEDGLFHLRERATLRRALTVAASLSGRRAAVVLLAGFDPFPQQLAGLVRSLRLPLPGEDERVAVVTAQMETADAETADAETVARAAALLAGLTEPEVAQVLREAMAERGPDLLAALRRRKVEVVRRTRYLEILSPEGALERIGGLDLLKRWLVQRRRAFHPEARRFGLPEPKGLFLLGIQGCGKSLVARTTANVLELPLVRLDFAGLFASDGPPERGMREMLAACDTLAPVVLWIDEIDKLFSVGRGDDLSLSRVLAAFLTWLQERRAPVFVVATANAVEGLPPELLRKGRFDELFFVDLPGVLERQEILRIHLSARGRDPACFDLAGAARAAEYFSGAELEQAVIGALFRAFEAERELEPADLGAELAATVPLYATSERSIRGLREFARDRTRPATSSTDVLDLFRR